MKKIILITSIIALTAFSSCQNKKTLAPQNPIPTAVEDTLNMEVYFTDTTTNFSSADFTLTVVDITAGENSTVFVETTHLNGVLANTTYTGNKIRLPRTSGVERIYRIYIGGRTATSPFLGNSTHDTGFKVYPYFPSGYLDVAVGTTGTLRSFPDKALFYFSTLDTGGSFAIF